MSNRQEKSKSAGTPHNASRHRDGKCDEVKLCFETVCDAFLARDDKELLNAQPRDVSFAFEIRASGRHITRRILSIFTCRSAKSAQ